MCSTTRSLAGKRHTRNNPDFPLRRFVRCGQCDSPLTGSWSRSQTGRRYGYYGCRDCGQTRTRREALEERFLELLDRLKPKPEYLEALRESVLEVWRDRERELEEEKPIIERRLADLERQKKRLVEVYIYQQAIDEDTYRRELLRLDQAIAVAKVEGHGNELDGLDVETVLEFAEHVVVNARRMWSEFDLRKRRHLQKVLFPQGLVLDSSEAFRTPVTCLFFRVLEAPEPRAGKAGSAYGIRNPCYRRERRGSPRPLDECAAKPRIQRRKLAQIRAWLQADEGAFWPRAAPSPLCCAACVGLLACCPCKRDAVLGGLGAAFFRW